MKRKQGFMRFLPLLTVLISVLLWLLPIIHAETTNVSFESEVSTPTPANMSLPPTPHSMSSPYPGPSTPTPGGRSTRAVGLIEITADTFVNLPNGQTEASGDVWLGDYLYLSGNDDSVIFSDNTINGTGTLALRQEGLALFTGSFNGSGSSGLATPDVNVSYHLNQIAGFTVDDALKMTQIDIPSATINGTTGLNLSPPGINILSLLTFTISPGPTFAGTFDAFDFDLAGVTLQVPAGTTLTDDGIDASSVTLVVPDIFGGATTTVNDLHISPDSLTLGESSFSLPDLLIDDGTVLKLTNNQASLIYDSDNQAYELDITTVLSLNLPDNKQSIPLTVRLASVNGESYLSGTVPKLTLSIAGSTLNMSDLTLSHDGLFAETATFTLPEAFNNTSTTLHDVSISKSGLRIGGGNLALSDIKIGDGSKVKISAITAEVAISGNNYTLLANGTLHLNLPNNTQQIEVSFHIDSSGNMNGIVDQIDLDIAKATLTMRQAAISNTGVAVDMATVKLPQSLGGNTATLSDVSITENGLQIGGGGFTLPDIKIGNGSKVKINDPAATISTNASGYTIGFRGILQLRLPQNSKNIDIAGSISSSGQVSATLSQLMLKVANANLNLSNLSFSNNALSAVTGTLRLPSTLGGATGTVNDVIIDNRGLRIGSGSTSFPLPDIRLGSSSGFRMTSVTGRLQLASRAYKLRLDGRVRITIPGANTSATGNIWVDQRGRISGNVSRFSLGVAGLEFAASNAKINDSTIEMTYASLKTPRAWGGVGATVYNTKITPWGGIRIGGGRFNVPTIKAGGFNLGDLEGSLRRVSNGYQIYASGKFGVPGLVEAGGNACAIGVGLTIFVTTRGETVLDITPSDGPPERLAIAPDGEPLNISHISHNAEQVGTQQSNTSNKFDMAFERPLPAEELDQLRGLQLRNINARLFGCRMPIGNTGFSLTGAQGRLTLNQGSTRVDIGVRVESDLRFGYKAAIRADADAYFRTRPTEFGFHGAVYVFVMKAAEANLKINQRDGFKATLWVRASVIEGQLYVHAWSDYGGFHLTGRASVYVGIPEGRIYSGCFPYPCGLNCGCRRWFRCSCNVKTCRVCLDVPPSNWWFARVFAEFGEFRGNRYGFKGRVSLSGFNAGFFVDHRGRIRVGNVDGYQLVDSYQVLQARQLWKDALAQRAIRPEQAWVYNGVTYRFNENSKDPKLSEIIINTPITTTTDVVFGITRNSDVPTLTLLTPEGAEITPNNLPNNIQYQEVVTYVVRAEENTRLAGVAPQIAGNVQFSGHVTPTMSVPYATTETAVQVCEAQIADLVTQSEDTYLRFVNGLSDAPAVDLLVDDEIFFSNVPSTGQEDYTFLPAGSHTIKVVLSGSSDPILTLNLDLTGGDYTLVAYGRAGQAQSRLLTDDLSKPDAGIAHVRVVPLLPDSPLMDVIIAQEGIEVPVEQVAYQTASPYSDLDAGTYDLTAYVADTATVVKSINDITFVDGGVYTVFVIPQTSDEADSQIVVHSEILPTGRIRIVNTVPNGSAIKATIRDLEIFNDVTYNMATAYLGLNSDAYGVLITDEQGTRVVSTTLDIASGTDYSLALIGDAENVEPILLVDDNRLPPVGQARMRLAHLSPDTPAVDVALQNGAVLFSNLSYKQASDYLTVDGNSYNLELRLAGTDTVLLNLSEVTLTEGYVYTLFLTGLQNGEPGLQAMMNTDLVTDKSTEVAYIINAAEVGDWAMKLTGDIGPDDTYLLSVFGSNPAPALSEVSTVINDPLDVEISWRLASDDADTKISIYATEGPLTTTQVVTNTNGMTETVTVPLYTGSALATGLTAPDDPNWINGTPQRHTLNVNQLKSGTYWIWLEADDERNTPVRVYAPEPIVVDHATSWEDSWTANIQVTPTYRGLDVQWERHSHPDVDSYLLRLGTAPLSVTEVITVGNFISTTWLTLDPGQPYYLSIAAQDEEEGRLAISEEVTAIPDVALFDISASKTDFALTGGSSTESVLRLTTALDPYPEEVGLYAGELPDGIEVVFESTVITPTITGVAVSVTISTTHTLIGGQYTVPIVASGGGVTRTLPVNVTILEPRFALTLSPSAVMLREDKSATVVVSASGINGEEDPIWLNLADAPSGLDWVFSSEVVTPSTDVTLTLTDTDMLAHGQYELYIEGEDGENTERITLTLNIYQPSFALETDNPRLALKPGDTSVLALDVMTQNGWSKPITVSLDPQSIPSQTTMGFLTDPSTGIPQPEITVTHSSNISLVVETTQNTPEGLYLLTVNAHSGEQEQTIVLELLVDHQAPSNPTLYLPIIME